MIRLLPNLIVRERNISIPLQCIILSLFARGISRSELIFLVHGWHNCSLPEATKIVDSISGTCIREPDEWQTQVTQYGQY